MKPQDLARHVRHARLVVGASGILALLSALLVAAVAGDLWFALPVVVAAGVYASAALGVAGVLTIVVALLYDQRSEIRK